MEIEKIFNQYYTPLDDSDKRIIDARIDEKGIENFLSHQLVYLDCSRIIKGMRMMQTIGYPYKREISSYLYALENQVNFLTVENSDVSKFNKQEWINKLIELHEANLKYEEVNPPIWYGSKKAKEEFESKTSKTPRRRKSKEQTIPGMGKEVKAQATLKAKLAGCANISFKIKPPKKD